MYKIMPVQFFVSESVVDGRGFYGISGKGFPVHLDFREETADVLHKQFACQSGLKGFKEIRICFTFPGGFIKRYTADIVNAIIGLYFLPFADFQGR